MRTYPIYPYWFSTTALTQNQSSSAQKIDYTIGYSVQANLSGSNGRGTLSLQASIDGTNFAEVQNSSVLMSSSGTYVWNVMSANYDYVRFNLASSAGANGSLTVLFYSKGF